MLDIDGLRLPSGIWSDWGMHRKAGRNDKRRERAAQTMRENKRVGEKLKELRILSGCTQEQVANDLAISQSYLRMIEHGKANPSVNMVHRIYLYLKTRLEEKGIAFDPPERG